VLKTVANKRKSVALLLSFVRSYLFVV